MSKLSLEIQPDWTFSEIVKDHLKALRDQYEDTLRFFSYFDLHMEVEFKRNTRNAIYALNFEEWKKDRIWDYMNRYEFYYVIRAIVKREEDKKNRRHTK